RDQQAPPHPNTWKISPSKGLVPCVAANPHQLEEFLCRQELRQVAQLRLHLVQPPFAELVPRGTMCYHQRNGPVTAHHREVGDISGASPEGTRPELLQLVLGCDL